MKHNIYSVEVSADFPANFFKFQIFAKRSIFVVQKRLLYKKASNLNEEYNASVLK